MANYIFVKRVVCSMLHVVDGIAKHTFSILTAASRGPTMRLDPPRKMAAAKSRMEMRGNGPILEFHGKIHERDFHLRLS